MRVVVQWEGQKTRQDHGPYWTGLLIPEVEMKSLTWSSAIWSVKKWGGEGLIVLLQLSSRSLSCVCTVEWISPILPISLLPLLILSVFTSPLSDHLPASPPPPPFSLYLHLSSVSPPPHLTPPLPPRRLQQMAFSTESGSAWGFCLLKESISSPMSPTPRA